MLVSVALTTCGGRASVATCDGEERFVARLSHRLGSGRLADARNAREKNKQPISFATDKVLARDGVW